MMAFKCSAFILLTLIISMSPSTNTYDQGDGDLKLFFFVYLRWLGDTIIATMIVVVTVATTVTLEQDFDLVSRLQILSVFNHGLHFSISPVTTTTLTIAQWWWLRQAATQQYNDRCSMIVTAITFSFLFFCFFGRERYLPLLPSSPWNPLSLYFIFWIFQKFFCLFGQFLLFFSFPNLLEVHL